VCALRSFARCRTNALNALLAQKRQQQGHAALFANGIVGFGARLRRRTLTRRPAKLFDT